ncbi:MAG: DNA polymerase III subunit alpha [Spirochaetia bacterium]|nr:DNA polymerase III subunit alpha [Spirochaetia bacterium]
MNESKSQFFHLHVHSEYSLYDSTVHLHRYVEEATHRGLKHLAVTDSGNMFAALEFYRLCQEAGINPIIGCEFVLSSASATTDRVSERGTILLIAENNQGYHNLMQLSTHYHLDNAELLLTDTLLREYHHCLIALTAGMEGEVSWQLMQGKYEQAENRVLELQEIFDKDSLFLELQDNGTEESKTVNEGLSVLSARLGIPLVAANPVHYLHREEAQACQVLQKIGSLYHKGMKYNSEGQSDQQYLKSEDEMHALFSEFPEAIENTLHIAQRCRIGLPMSAPELPMLDIPSEYPSSHEYLRALVMEGLSGRYKQVSQEAYERIEKELAALQQVGYTDYLLIVADYIGFACKSDIPVGPGRGAAAGSLVAYALGITDIDPLKYGLLSERFLNPERIASPDIDTDFCYDRRWEVMDYVRDKFGEDRTANIITFGRYKARLAVRDVGRAMGLSYSEIESLARKIPLQPSMNLKRALEDNVYLQRAAAENPLNGKALMIAQVLEGLPIQVSTHAAGIVISRKAITSYSPLYRDRQHYAACTQYTSDRLTELGLVRYDFLGFKVLTLLQQCRDKIRENRSGFELTHIPDDDKLTFQLLGDGTTTGVFLCESSGMKGILQKDKPQNIEELTALTALYRPGAMELIPRYIEAKQSGRLAHLIPDLETILASTYGILVYQEQIMEIAHAVAGWPYGKADILRRTLSKPNEQLGVSMKRGFVKDAMGLGVSKDSAEGIFEMLTEAGTYAVLKAHSISYSLLAYRSAFLKAHFPQEFMQSLLKVEEDNPAKYEDYSKEAARMGLLTDTFS